MTCGDKKCSRCRVVKPRNKEYFFRRSSSKDGFQGICKICVLEAKKNGGVKKDNNSKRCSTCDVSFPLTNEYFHKREESKDGFRNSCKQCSCSWAYKWREENRELYLEQRRASRKTERTREKAREYKKQKHVKERRNIQRRERTKTDPEYRIKKNVSRAILAALKKNNSNKSNSSVWNYLPYNINDLREHLENQFDNEMTWANYGSYWHLDHIYPQSLLPYDSMKHPNFINCWSLSNLQPLEAKENIKKSNKIHIKPHPTNKTIITFEDGEQKIYEGG
jgi:hypothetical protein